MANSESNNAPLPTSPLQGEESKAITILGSTGTIGQNTLKLVAAHPKRFHVDTLTAGDNVALLAEQAKTFRAKRAVIANQELYGALKDALSGSDIQVASGDAAMETASHDADWVMSAIVGAAGLKPTLAAIRAGKTVALANKECLVCAGELIGREAAKHNATLIPVDSEHNGVFQLLENRLQASGFRLQEKVLACPEARNLKPEAFIQSITLTASGGPFRTWTTEQMRAATPEQAIRHPNWNMGAKISVDSATLMNKGLELIEAYHLFAVRADQLRVLIHPQSIVHCLVQMIDGSVLAQMSRPDMCTPIAYAMAWPKRMETTVAPLDLAAIGNLTFEAPDETRFPAFTLAKSVLEAGGSAPCVLNAANEIAVKRFLNKNIGFLDIAKIVEQTLEKMENTRLETIDDVLACDQQTRRIAETL